jgi:hypothetical protein
MHPFHYLAAEVVSAGAATPRAPAALIWLCKVG